MNRNIVKLYLYSYPELAALSEASEVAARNKALLSFRGNCALKDAEGVLRDYAHAGALAALKRALDGALAALTGEERALIAYKYFFSEQELALSCSERSYYRRQAASPRSCASSGGTTNAFCANFPITRRLRASSKRSPRAGSRRSVKNG